MTRAIRQYTWPVVVIILFAFLATAAGIYTIGHERTQNPFSKRFTVYVTFTRTPGLAPGLGQPAEVAGVEVGQVTDAKLVDGRSRVTVEVERSKLKHLFKDASATLRPNTPLEDLQVDLDPGNRASGVMPDGATINADRTNVPVSASGLLRALDGDTRRYLATLITSLGIGFDGRGGDLRDLFKQIGPTALQIDELTSALAKRQATLADVTDSLSALAVAAGKHDRDIQRVVDSGAATLRAMASQDTALRSSLAQLPATLAAARRSFTATTALSTELKPTLTALEPSIRRAPQALAAADKLTRTATPVLRNTVRPLVRTASPALQSVPSTLDHLNAVTPDLSTIFKLLTYAGNELFYNNGGKTKGYPYWAAWAQHNANSIVSGGDQESAVLRGDLILSCASIVGLGQISAPSLGLPNLSSVFNSLSTMLPTLCPTNAGDK